VYNTISNVIRLVNITPNSNWGGEGSIGCNVGYGYLHRIPITTEQKQANLTLAANYKIEPAKPNNVVNQTQPQQTVQPVTQLPPNTSPLPGANLIEQYQASLNQHLKKREHVTETQAPNSAVAQILSQNGNTTFTEIPLNSNTKDQPSLQIPKPMPLTTQLQGLTLNNIDSPVRNPSPILFSPGSPVAVEPKTPAANPSHIPTTSPTTPAHFSSAQTSPIPQTPLTPPHTNLSSPPSTVTTPISDQFINLQQLQQKQQELKEKLESLKQRQAQKQT